MVPLANLAADLGLLSDLDCLLPKKERGRGFGKKTRFQVRKLTHNGNLGESVLWQRNIHVIANLVVELVHSPADHPLFHKTFLVKASLVLDFLLAQPEKLHLPLTQV